MMHKHKEFLERSGELGHQRKERLQLWVRDLVEAKLHFDFWNSTRTHTLERELEEVYARRRTPYDLVDQLTVHSMNSDSTE
jgi:putative protein kinase ArgK-like GTPase of G3E family